MMMVSDALAGRKWVHACLPFSSAALVATRLIVPAANRPYA
jgi:hypothetical protein